MKFRPVSILILAALAAACAGDTGETEAPPEGAAAVEASPEDADVAALDELRAAYVEHYNLHHASMVADLYADGAVALLADGSVDDGKEAILAGLEEAMAGMPTLNLDGQGTVVFGDHAVSRGAWQIEITPEGAPEAMTQSGHWMTLFERVNGEWKIGAVLTNYDAAPPEGFVFADPPEEAADELVDGPVADLIEYYQTHYNMGHAGMVAELFAEDAAYSPANGPLAEGRAAIEAALTAQLEGGPQLAIHDVAAWEFDDGWVVDAGWYEIAVDDTPTAWGIYMGVSQRVGEGLPSLHWLFSNQRPAGS